MLSTQIIKVRGDADRKLRDREHPTSRVNRRVSIIVSYVKPPEGETDKMGAERWDGFVPPKAPFTSGTDRVD